MEPAKGRGYHPQTQVNFAATEAFERTYGKTEADKQQAGFEKPSWHTAAVAPIPRTPSPAGSASALPGHFIAAETVFLFSLGFVAGIAAGLVVARWTQS